MNVAMLLSQMRFRSEALSSQNDMLHDWTTFPKQKVWCEGLTKRHTLKRLDGRKEVRLSDGALIAHSSCMNKDWAQDGVLKFVACCNSPQQEGLGSCLLLMVPWHACEAINSYEAARVTENTRPQPDSLVTMTAFLLMFLRTMDFHLLIYQSCHTL